MTKESEFPGVVNERPEGEDYELYKTFRRLNKKHIKVHLKGTIDQDKVPPKPMPFVKKQSFKESIYNLTHKKR